MPGEPASLIRAGQLLVLCAAGLCFAGAQAQDLADRRARQDYLLHCSGCHDQDGSGHPPQLDSITAPVMMITEAKNDSVMGGLGQCAATMVAAQRFNRGRNPDVTTIYGCVSNGLDWKFLRLDGTTLAIDLDDYVIHDPGRILGIILHFVGLAPITAAA